MLHVMRRLFHEFYLLSLSIFLSDTGVIDGQAYTWPCSVFTQKKVFGPRTAKSQPI